jgi:hypothetical protein
MFEGFADPSPTGSQRLIAAHSPNEPSTTLAQRVAGEGPADQSRKAIRY